MKLCLLAIGFVLLLSIDEGESGRCRLMMRPYCRYECDGCSLSCGFRFSMMCFRRRKKRSTEEGADSGGFWVHLPCKFSAWDTDKDGSITLTEFAFAGHTKAKDSNTGIAFKKVDKDGNKKISIEEFDAAPLVLENC